MKRENIRGLFSIALSFCLLISATACGGQTKKALPSSYKGKEFHLTIDSDGVQESINELNRRLLRYDEYAIGDTTIPEPSFNSFNTGWQVKSLVWHNATEEALGEDKIPQIYTKFLKSKTQDDYGYIYNQNDFREEPKWGGIASWGPVAGGPQGWTFPTWQEAVENPLDSNGVADRYFTSFDFNTPNDDTNKNWTAENGTFEVDGSGYARFSGGNAGENRSYRLYKEDLASLLTAFGGISGKQAAFIETDMDFEAKNLEDIRLIWKTAEGGDVWYEAFAKDYVTVPVADYSSYGSRAYWTMYQNENWYGKTITAIGLEFVPESGTELSLTNGKLNYIRPSYDTRQPQFAFQWFEAFYNYVCYTQDETALKELMPKARKAMLFMLHCMQGETGLVNLDFFCGHNGIGTTINADGSVTTHPGEGIASGYWDTLALPETNLETNAYFYTCLKEMAELEAYCEKKGIEIEGVTIKNRETGGERVSYDYDSAKLYTLLEKVETQFSKDVKVTKKADGRYANEGGLWNPATGRFALGINELTGEIVDHGYVLFNEQAIVAGLGTEEQRLSVMQWINGDRTVAGDLSTGSDIYFYEFAPRFTTADCISQFNFCLAKLNFGDDSAWKTYGSLFSRQVQNGGAVLWASYYDLAARAQVLGAENAYSRLKGISEWYQKVKAETDGEGTAFFENYYYNLEIYGENGGNGYYVRQAANLDGAGAIGLDSEFLENAVFVRAIPDAFFGMKTLSPEVIEFSYNKPAECDYLRLDNLKFGNAVYSVAMTENSYEISTIEGAVYKDTKVRFCFSEPKGDYKVYINDEETTDYTIKDGFVYVEVSLSKVKITVK